MTGDALARQAAAPPGNVTLDVLRYLGLDPAQIEARALVLLCSRYSLDPLLGHVAVIKTRHGQKVYVTRDGLLAVAHRSGLLNGIEVLEERRSSGDDGWTARVAVHVKGQDFPYIYGAQCKDAEDQAKAGNGPEMALARAERRALRRAFSVPAGNVAEGSPDDIDTMADDVIELPPPAAAPRQLGGSNQSAAHAAISQLPMDDQRAFLTRHGIEDFGSVWHDEAVIDALGESPS